MSTPAPNPGPYNPPPAYNPGPYPTTYNPGGPSSALPGYRPVDPAAPYGRDPATGVPLSDKSSIVAAALQAFFGCWGAGRFYIGDMKMGALQLGSFLISLALIFVVIGLFTLPCVAIWGVIDGFMMLNKKVPDSKGRQLR